MTLRESIAALVHAAPPTATVPVSWLGELLATEGQPGTAAHDNASLDVDLTVAQVAERFGKGQSTVRTWLQRGELAGAYRLHGREWRIPSSAVHAMQLEQAKRHGASTAAARPSRSANLADWRKHVPRARGA